MARLQNEVGVCQRRDRSVMFQYGALNHESAESSILQRRDQNRASRAWPISTVLLSIMTATVLFMLWDGDGEIISDIQPVITTQSNELQVNHHVNYSTHLNAKKNSLVSSEAPIYGNYVDDMPDRPAYFPSSQTLVRGSVKVQCSDTVAWGRLVDWRSGTKTCLLTKSLFAVLDLRFLPLSLVSMDQLEPRTRSSVRMRVRR